jgi:hypothetical protein
LLFLFGASGSNPARQRYVLGYPRYSQWCHRHLIEPDHRHPCVRLVCGRRHRQMIVPLRYESQRAMIREAMPVDVVVKATRGPRGLDRRRSRKQRRRARAANGRDERGLVLFPILGRAATKRTLSGHRHTNETLPEFGHSPRQPCHIAGAVLARPPRAPRSPRQPERAMLGEWRDQAANIWNQARSGYYVQNLLHRLSKVNRV